MPVSVADARTHLRIHSSVASEDLRIERLIKAATAWVEQWTGRRLVTQSVTELWDSFPSCRAYLHVYPITSLVVKYDDTDDVERTLSASEYWSHITRRPPMLESKSGWPSTKAKAAAVRIECEVGTTAELVPDEIKESIFHLVEHLYENPGVILTGSAQLVPMGVKVLLANHKLFF